MNVMRLSIAVIVVYVVLAALAILSYEVLLTTQFEPFRAAIRPREEMGFWPYVGYLIQVVLFCAIFTKGYENKGVMEGVRYGILMGLLLAATDWVWTLHLPGVPGSTGLLAAVVSLILWIVAGAILAAIYKPAEAKAEASS